MGRQRKFTREKVLQKAMPLFWSRGFASTALQELEQATGVNKSGLYTEFKDKEEIFTACLLYYLETRQSIVLLTKEPLGWHNIESFFRMVVKECSGNEKGCFAVNSMRELDLLPSQAKEIVTQSTAQLKQLMVKNISQDKTCKSPEMLAELLVTFFSGITIEQNLDPTKMNSLRKVRNFIRILRAK